MLPKPRLINWPRALVMAADPMEPVRVLVTGVGGRSVGHQILSALRRASRAYWIVATDMEAFSFGLYMADARYLVPAATDPDYLRALCEIVRRERVEVVLPGTEAELRVLSASRAVFESLGCALVASPGEIVERCLNKATLYEWLASHGYGVPRTADREHWRELAAEVGYPLVGKPAENSGGSRGVCLLADEHEVWAFLAENGRTRTPVVFQEYVGAGESEYTVGVLIDRDGGVIDSIVLHRKLIGVSLGLSRMIDGRSYELSTGYSQGVIETEPQLSALCETLAQEIGIRGPANVQLRLDRGAAKIFEVHPRFSGTTSIRAECGFNEPDVLIGSLLLGERAQRIDYRRNVAAIRAFQNVIVPIAEMSAVAGFSAKQG
jgi:carbamoyl-phosphate synthase large subunit